MQYPQTMALETREQRQMGMFLHLSQLAHVIFPLLGVVLPVVLWQTQKERMPALDAHGKMIVNWMISTLIYTIICIPFVLIFIGILMLIALWITGVIFAIVGAVKANNGELWQYPLTIKFIK